MELCDRGSVTDLIAKHKTLTEEMIKPISKSVLGGLVYMHERKIVHRDIKPGNLLLTARGEIKLGAIGRMCDDDVDAGARCSRLWHFVADVGRANAHADNDRHAGAHLSTHITCVSVMTCFV
jgi:serine/threonine protein kinase